MGEKLRGKKAIAKQAYEIADAMIEARGEVENVGGWIEWDSGLCPVAPLTEVQVKFRTGCIGLFPMLADDVWWSHLGDESDIIAYRVVKP